MKGLPPLQRTTSGEQDARQISTKAMSVHRSQVFRLYTQNTRRCRLTHILCTYIYIYTSLTFTRYIILYTNPTLRRLNHQVQDMVVGRYLRLTAARLISFPPSTIQAYGKSIWRCHLENDGHQQLLGFKFYIHIYGSWTTI